jgi:prepilin-type N-terminal cleavage/methylation domain-containing protein
MVRHVKDRGFTLIELLIVIIILGILAAIATFAVQASSGKSPTDSNNVPNTDPRNGWVRVDDDFNKRCDGPNMLYYDTYHGTYNVAANSQECAG